MKRDQQFTALICTGTLWVLLALALLPNTSRAACNCVCVEGSVQAVCDNSIEPRPMCGPTLCAPAPDVRMPEPLVANPGKKWLYTSPPDTKIGDGSYDWMEVGEAP